METMMYTIGSAPLRDAPNGNYIQDIPPGAIVKWRGEGKTAPYKRVEINWLHVSYRDISGWAYAGYFEPYTELLETGVFINSLATPAEYDVPQNLIWDGRTMVNQCGELCVSYVVGTDVSEVLQNWQRKNSWWYQYVFGSSKDRGTDTSALLDILNAIGESGELYFDLLRDAVRGVSVETPRKVANLLGEYKIITSVKIDKVSGKLSKSGILHWVVLEHVEPERDGGLVYVANPYHDRIERYDWEQYKAATGSVPYGVAVLRDDAQVSVSTLLAQEEGSEPLETQDSAVAECIAQVQAYIDDTRDFIAEQSQRLDALEKVVLK